MQCKKSLFRVAKAAFGCKADEEKLESLDTLLRESRERKFCNLLQQRIILLPLEVTLANKLKYVNQELSKL